MKRLERQMKELGFSTEMKEIDIKTFLDIDRNLSRGEWDNRLGEKPQVWDTLPRRLGFPRKVFGRLSKRDIQRYVLPRIPFVRKRDSTDEGNDK